MKPEARYWLRFQMVMAVVGAVLWYVGVVFDSEYTSGLGVGVLLSALALRILRRNADDEVAEDREDTA